MPPFLRMTARDCTEVVGRSFWEPPLVADADAGAEIHRHLLAGGAVMKVEPTDVPAAETVRARDAAGDRPRAVPIPVVASP